MDFGKYIEFIDQALLEAQRGEELGEVPIGAVVVKDGQIIARAHNSKESQNCPTGHAEIEVLNLAAKKLSNWRLTDCTLFVTLEPCPMCLAAMVQARIKRLVFGAYDSKGGAISLGHDLHKDSRLNHNFAVVGGVNQLNCSKMLTDFFKKKRSKN